jgi:gas vesicle protein
VNERQILVAGGILGALAGSLVSYLFFTTRGREWRADLEGNLSAILQEADRLLSAADQVRHSVAEMRGKEAGWPRSA